MYVASESDSTCVCDKSWAGGRRGAQGPLRIKWGHRCSRPPTYNSTISQVPNNCCSMYQTIVPWTSSMWQAAAWAKDQPASRTFNCAPHLLPARPTVAATLLPSFSVTASPIFVPEHGCAGSNKAAHHFRCCPISLLTADSGPRARRGSVLCLSDSPKDMIGENISLRMWHMGEVTCESWQVGQLASVAEFGPIVTPNPHPNAHFPCNGRLFNHTRFSSTDLAGWLWVIVGRAHVWVRGVGWIGDELWAYMVQ